MKKEKHKKHGVEETPNENEYPTISDIKDAIEKLKINRSIDELPIYNKMYWI
jgi:hypothetical protein